MRVLRVMYGVAVGSLFLLPFTAALTLAASR